MGGQDGKPRSRLIRRRSPHWTSTCRVPDQRPTRSVIDPRHGAMSAGSERRKRRPGVHDPATATHGRSLSLAERLCPATSSPLRIMARVRRRSARGVHALRCPGCASLHDERIDVRSYKGDRPERAPSPDRAILRATREMRVRRSSSGHRHPDGPRPERGSVKRKLSRAAVPPSAGDAKTWTRTGSEGDPMPWARSAQRWTAWPRVPLHTTSIKRPERGE
jgi:hypothetical protein